MQNEGRDIAKNSSLVPSHQPWSSWFGKPLCKSRNISITPNRTYRSWTLLVIGSFSTPRLPSNQISYSTNKCKVTQASYINVFSSHLPAAPTTAIDGEDLKEDSHVCSQGNGSRDVAMIHSLWIGAGISWAFHGVVNNLRARLKENGNERKKTW